MEDWRIIVGANVRRLRKAAGMTQKQLAFEVKLDLTDVGGIERGKRNPSLLVMARLAASMGADLEELIKR